MRPLAEFIVRGHKQALLVAILGISTLYFYWIGAAAVGLVTLRKGLREGFMLMLWASLPAAGLWIWFQEVMPLATLIGTTIAAAFLRWTVSWRAALLTATASGLITSVLLLTLASDYLMAFVSAYSDFMAQIQQEIARQGQQQDFALAALNVDSVFVAGIFGVIQALTTAISTIIARWWQAMLYNPGGFQQEFHGLRMTPLYAFILLAIIASFGFSGSNYTVWSAIAAIPLLICGIALVHGVLAIRKLSTNWLIFFYVLLVLVDGMKVFVVVLALIDSLLNYRQRLTKNNANSE